jgi:uncharacterized membrane protein required for colicin V production
MENISFNPVDLVVIVILVVGFVWGFSSGFIHMVLSLAAIIVGIFIAGKLTPLIINYFVSEKYGTFGYILIFVLIFILVYFIIKKLTYLIEDMIEFLELEWLDSLLGGCLGLLQFFILMGLFINLLRKMNLIGILPYSEDMTITYIVAENAAKIVAFIAGSLKNANISITSYIKDII